VQTKETPDQKPSKTSTFSRKIAKDTSLTIRETNTPES